VIRYNTYRSHLKKRFGKPVLKIPLNAGFSCPNRDGTISFEGCSFCDNRSFSPAAVSTAPVLDQLKTAIERDRNRHEAFIAYLQPFSNTYGDAKLLKSIYEPVIMVPKVVGLTIGTRPDCFTEETYNYLEELSKRTYLSVEIGLQSASDETLRINNRGHDVKAFVKAVTELSRRTIETVAHVMIGLPFETRKQTMEAAGLLASLPVTGIKIHQLMIIAGTKVQEWYNEGKVKPLPLEEYADILCEFLSYIRPEQLIHRIMADSRVKNGLIAPMWSADKVKSIKIIHDLMDKRELVQGSNFKIS
jgi:radical SAM protein (TIGR01212 family)